MAAIPLNNSIMSAVQCCDRSRPFQMSEFRFSCLRLSMDLTLFLVLYVVVL